MPKASLRLGVCVLLVSLLIPVSSVLAASRFDSGFRGVVWGTHKADLPDLGISEKALKGIYKNGPSAVIFMEGVGSLDMNIDRIPLLSIFLRFQNQVFHGVDLIFKAEDREKIESLIASEMQTEAIDTNEGRMWSSGPLNILITDRELMISHKEYVK